MSDVKCTHLFEVTAVSHEVLLMTSMVTAVSDALDTTDASPKAETWRISDEAERGIRAPGAAITHVWFWLSDLMGYDG